CPLTLKNPDRRTQLAESWGLHTQRSKSQSLRKHRAVMVFQTGAKCSGRVIGSDYLNASLSHVPQLGRRCRNGGSQRWYQGLKGHIDPPAAFLPIKLWPRCTLGRDGWQTSRKCLADYQPKIFEGAGQNEQIRVSICSPKLIAGQCGRQLYPVL